jgi:hypothetical protein
MDSLPFFTSSSSPCSVVMFPSHVNITNRFSPSFKTILPPAAAFFAFLLPDYGNSSDGSAVGKQTITISNPTFVVSFQSSGSQSVMCPTAAC